MRIRSIWLTQFAGWLTVFVGRMLFATCRIHYLSHEPKTRLDYFPAPEDEERFILSVWHDELLIPTFTSVHRGITTCLVSKHQDGSYLAAALKELQFDAVRGSSQRGGAQAARQLIEETNGKHLVITPDGPRGPRHVLKPGAVYFASVTGRRLVAGAFACRPGWRIAGSWTDQLIPLPFSTIYAYTGPALEVPPDLSRDELNRYLSLAQEAMDDAQKVVQRIARGETMAAERAIGQKRAA